MLEEIVRCYMGNVLRRTGIYTTIDADAFHMTGRGKGNKVRWTCIVLPWIDVDENLLISDTHISFLMVHGAIDYMRGVYIQKIVRLRDDVVIWEAEPTHIRCPEDIVLDVDALLE